jgi:hypothetical protein
MKLAIVFLLEYRTANAIMVISPPYNGGIPKKHAERRITRKTKTIKIPT